MLLDLPRRRKSARVAPASFHYLIQSDYFLRRVNASISYPSSLSGPVTSLVCKKLSASSGGTSFTVSSELAKGFLAIGERNFSLAAFFAG